MGVILILLQRNNETLFKNKENLNVRLLLTFPGAAGKDSFFMLPEWFLWFSCAIQEQCYYVSLLQPDTDMGTSTAGCCTNTEQPGGPCPKELRIKRKRDQDLW